MYYVSEETVRTTIDQNAVTEVISEVFVSLAEGLAVNFPVVRETLGYADAIFGFKSGFDRSGPVLGVKAGGLWPGNRDKGLANHQSTIVLFDPETGSPHALVRGTYLTALRTAAASVLSIRHLARPDACVLGILGAGGQSEFQLRAALGERSFEEILISDQDVASAEGLVGRLADTGVAARSCDPETLAGNADVLITVTPSFEPVIRDEWVGDGTHIAAMGADTRGKQELEAALVGRARVFGDEAEQAVSIGECQHAAAAGLLRSEDICTLGRVIAGTDPGRRSHEEITLFDSTGMGLQDLAAATLALKIAREKDLAVELD